jgi:hypothetical protein
MEREHLLLLILLLLGPVIAGLRALFNRVWKGAGDVSSEPLEVMEEWAKSLDDGRVETLEGAAGEISTSGLGRYAAWGEDGSPDWIMSFMALGTRHGRPVQAIWSDNLLLSAGGGWSLTRAGGLSVYQEHMLEVSLNEASLPFEATLTRRTWFGKLLSAIGVGRGLRPVDHALFKAYKLVQDVEPDSGRLYFEDPSYCDAVLSMVERTPVLRVEYQSKTGVVFYRRAPLRLLTVDFIEAAVSGFITVVEAAPPARGG